MDEVAQVLAKNIRRKGMKQNINESVSLDDWIISGRIQTL
jgi:hypothetical protein